MFDKLKKFGKKHLNHMRNMDEQGKANTLYLSLAIGVLIAVLTLGAFQIVLPMVFGITFTGIVASVSSRLAAVGGVVGSITGTVAEMIGNYTTYIVQPALNFNPLAIFAFASTMIFAAVIAVNVWMHDQVWR
jgi:hypothetical protein